MLFLLFVVEFIYRQTMKINSNYLQARLADFNIVYCIRSQKIKNIKVYKNILQTH